MSTVVAPVEIIPVGTRGERQRFIGLPYSLHKGDPHWVPPLRLERAQVLDSKKNPFFEHGSAQLFLAVRGGRDVGRISAHIDSLHLERYGDSTGFFGFFDAVDDVEVARVLLNAARVWLSTRGMARIRGPLNFTMNDDVGVLVRGFDSPPYIMMTHNPPYYDALLKACGLAKAKDLWAWEYDVKQPVPPKLLEAAELANAVPGLVVRHIDRSRLHKEVRLVMEVFNEAWGDNWGFIPMTERGLAKMAEDLALILEPRLTLVAELHGEAVAIAIALPDLHEALRGLNGRLLPLGAAKLLWRLKVQGVKRTRLILLGLRKAARGGPLWGLSFHLYARMHALANELGYTHAELSWTLEDNHKVNKGIERMGGRHYKTYRIYEGGL